MNELENTFGFQSEFMKNVDTIWPNCLDRFPKQIGAILAVTSAGNPFETPHCNALLR